MQTASTILCWLTKGLGATATESRKEKQDVPRDVSLCIRESLQLLREEEPAAEAVQAQIEKTLQQNRSLLAQIEQKERLPEASLWTGTAETWEQKAAEIQGTASKDTDIERFRSLLVSACQALAEIETSAAALQAEDADIDVYIHRALGQTLDDALTGGNLLALCMEAGRYGVRAMDLLGRARRAAEGECHSSWPEPLSTYADVIKEAVEAKTIPRIVVVLGDAIDEQAVYYTELAERLPESVLFLTGGSVASYLPEQGKTVNEIPRVIRVGEVEDTYAVIQFALRLRSILGVDNLNQLSMRYFLSLHSPASILAFLSLLYLDIKQIHIGPVWPDFLSGGIREVMERYFKLQQTQSAAEDAESLLAQPSNLIKEDMIVGDIVQEYPSLVPVMTSVGLHCIGCGVSQMETLEEACMTHGLDVYDILDILNEQLQTGGA